MNETKIMDADAESRADEKLAMECIYSSELFTSSETADSGQFSAQVNLPRDFHVKGSPKPGLCFKHICYVLLIIEINNYFVT